MRVLLATLLLGACAAEPESTPGPFGAGGHEPETESPVHIDEFVQADLAPVDVLLVLDNSPNMIAYEASLASIAMDVADRLDAHPDWRVAATTTDPAEAGALRLIGGRPYLDEHAPDGLVAITPLDGSEDEQGRAAVAALLESNPHRFLREEADLHVIFVSNEDDHTVEPEIDVFVEQVLEDKGESTRMSSIVTPPDVLPEVGSAYHDLTDRFGGIKWNIRDLDWMLAVDQLGILTRGLKREYPLSRIPLLEPFTLRVRVREDKITYVFDRDETGDPACEDCFMFHKSRNSVTFNNYVPGPGTTVEVEYEVAGER